MTLSQLHPILKILLAEGCTAAQLNILLEVHCAISPMCMSKVAKAAGHSTAAATGAVDSLEKRGFLSRNYGSKDRRLVTVSLSEAGKDFLKKIEAKISKPSVN